MGEAFLIGFGGTLGVLAAFVALLAVAALGFVFQLFAKAIFVVVQARRKK